VNSGYINVQFDHAIAVTGYVLFSESIRGPVMRCFIWSIVYIMALDMK